MPIHLPGRLEFDSDAKKCVAVDAVVDSGRRPPATDRSDARRQRRPEDRGSDRGRRCRRHRRHLRRLLHRLRRLPAVLVEVQRQERGQNGGLGFVSLPLHRRPRRSSQVHNLGHMASLPTTLAHLIGYQH